MIKYRLTIEFILQLGLSIGYSDTFININLPFLSILICLDKESYGYNIFNKHFDN